MSDTSNPDVDDYLFTNPIQVQLKEACNSENYYECFQELASGNSMYRFLVCMAGTLHEPVTTLLQTTEDQYRQAMKRRIEEAHIKTKYELRKTLVQSVISAAFKNVEVSFEGDTVRLQTPNAFEATKERIQALVHASPIISSEANVDKLLANINSELKENTLNKDGLSKFIKDMLEEDEKSRKTEQHTEFIEHHKIFFKDKYAYIMMTNEAQAAIISSYTLLTQEVRHRYGLTLMHPKDLIESKNILLKTAFAELCAHKYSNARMFQSQASSYVGIQPARVNMKMLQLGLQKCAMRVVEASRHR